jgi:glycosyltransferase involved in cell wall biosynthesis
VVPNIVDPALAHPFPQDSPLIRILVVADLVDEIKNVSAVIRAFHSLTSSQPNAILQIVGDGPDRSRLESQAGETGLLDKKIFFHGRMDNVEVYKYLSECSFLVMNSNLETFSLICAEALCCGKPVVATRCGGPEDFLSEETGMLIETGNDVQLSEAMQRMIQQFRNYEASKLKMFATDHFSADKIGKMYADIYQDLLSAGKDSSH